MNAEIFVVLSFFVLIFGSLAFVAIRECRERKRISRENAMAKDAANKARDALGMHFKYEVYKDKKGEYRFRFKSNNGNIMAVASEGYKHKADVLNVITRLKYSKISKIVHLDTVEQE